LLTMYSSWSSLLPLLKTFIFLISHPKQPSWPVIVGFLVWIFVDWGTLAVTKRARNLPKPSYLNNSVLWVQFLTALGPLSECLEGVWIILITLRLFSLSGFWWRESLHRGGNENKPNLNWKKIFH
jgi:hypothetical protein